MTASLDTISAIQIAVQRVVLRCATFPGLIASEADAQAELHAELLTLLSDQVPLDRAPGLFTYDHHIWPMAGCRVHREISATSSRSTPRSDILILGNGPQQILAKASGAPARFRGPVEALIELKLDVGRIRPARIQPAIQKDFSKWRDEVKAGAAVRAVAVVFTDRPADYDSIHDTDVIIAPLPIPGSAAPTPDPRLVAEAVDASINEVVRFHAANPLAMIREKDFETRLLRTLRDCLGTQAAAARSQSRARCARTGALRPLDIAVLSGEPAIPIITVIEIKTSHSATFKTLGRGQLEDEAAFLDGLIDAGVCREARVAVFRYGRAAKADDVEEWSQRWERLRMTYSCC